ncbi:MAG: hypothetical protein HY901_15575 [Deltaproteobacteria bacterium]|nr:hypothetical protein [Deltaproteobacteria bacterium]
MKIATDEAIREQAEVPCLCRRSTRTPAFGLDGLIHTPDQCGIFESGRPPRVHVYVPITGGPQAYRDAAVAKFPIRERKNP